MSVNALTVINEAAALVGDPAFSRITQPAWGVIQNNSCRDLAIKLRLVMNTATFDIAANGPEYAWPSDCIQIKWMQFSETPSDQTTWWDVGELFEDEFRSRTNGNYPTASRSLRYFAMRDTFFLYPMPSTAISGGGKLRYWGLPDDITSPATQNIPLRDTFRDTLRQRMLVYGLRRLEEWDAASQAEKEWEASLTVDRDRLEDPSADRRPRIRTRLGNMFGQR